MENKICLDTDFLINLLKNKKEKVDFIKEKEDKNLIATTYINLFELYYGAFKLGKVRGVISIELLKHRLEILNLNDDVVRKAGEIAAILKKSGRMIDFRDLLIGVISLVNNFYLKTYNVSDFSRIPDLELI